MNSHETKFPGGSKSRVNRAGKNIRKRIALPEDYDVLEEWRSAHRAVLNTFQAILRNRTKGISITVAQRHKRRATIIDKLSRYPSMQLARMDDVAGCRLIFNDIQSLYEFRKEFHESHFHHKIKNKIDKYDYIKKPKESGYRGIHDVYGYDVNSVTGRPLKGLLIEIQYRTKIQHAWATAVEVVGFITSSQPKFQKGDTRYQHAMALASEITARSKEDCNGPYPEKNGNELVSEFIALDKELSLVNTLRGLNEVDVEVSSRRNVILIISPDGDLETKTYRSATDALRNLFELEKENPGFDIVLVKADTPEDVRFAFKNYFSDTKDFVQLLEDSCTAQSGVKKLTRRTKP
ncbi:MAG: (p)ppGpp synthetase [Gammaproteobacteria bacterium]|nr:(p)ppGpp synthetase [Gammaproteobacteria bacterium]